MPRHHIRGARHRRRVGCGVRKLRPRSEPGRLPRDRAAAGSCRRVGAVRDGRRAPETAPTPGCWVASISRGLAPCNREVFADEVVPFGLVAVNHLRTAGSCCFPPIRVVCANTLPMALKISTTHKELDGPITVTHTGEAHAKVIAAAAQLFAAIVERHEVIARHYQLLKQTVLSPADFRALVLDVVAPDPRTHAQWTPDARMAESVVVRYVRKRDEVRRLWYEGTGHLGDGSSWEAYNGAVEALDHRADLFPTRRGVYRTASLLDGTLRDLKHRVLDSLLTLAGASTARRCARADSFPRGAALRGATSGSVSYSDAANPKVNPTPITPTPSLGRALLRGVGHRFGRLWATALGTPLLGHALGAALGRRSALRGRPGLPARPMSVAPRGESRRVRWDAFRMRGPIAPTRQSRCRRCAAAINRCAIVMRATPDRVAEVDPASTPRARLGALEP